MNPNSLWEGGFIFTHHVLYVRTFWIKLDKFTIQDWRKPVFFKCIKCRAIIKLDKIVGIVLYNKLYKHRLYEYRWPIHGVHKIDDVICLLITMIILQESVWPRYNYHKFKLYSHEENNFNYYFNYWNMCFFTFIFYDNIKNNEIFLQ